MTLTTPHSWAASGPWQNGRGRCLSAFVRTEEAGSSPDSPDIGAPPCSAGPCRQDVYVVLAGEPLSMLVTFDVVTFSKRKKPFPGSDSLTAMATESKVLSSSSSDAAPEGQLMPTGQSLMLRPMKLKTCSSANSTNV